MDEVKVTTLNEDEKLEEIQSADEPKFTAEIQDLIDSAEQFRIRKMQTHSGRTSVSLLVGLSAMMLGGGGFAWYLLVEGNIFLALLCMLGAIVPPIFLNIWARAPINEYRREFKSKFMPAMAKTLGGLKYHPKRGIGIKVLQKTGVVPPFDKYSAEDCFMGKYKGVKIIFSEAHLSSKKSKDYIFDGIFVLLEIPEDTFEGTTIVTADHHQARMLSKSMQSVPISNPAHASTLYMLSDHPEQADRLNKDKLLKELYEMVVLFDNSPVTAVFFRKKYIFMMIPYSVDMFECSNLFLPITTKGTALQCKKEIDQILSIIDVLEIYQT